MRSPKERLRQADNAIPRGLCFRGHRTRQKMVGNGLGGTGVYRIQRITSTGTNSLSLIPRVWNYSEHCFPSLLLNVILLVQPPKSCGLVFCFVFPPINAFWKSWLVFPVTLPFLLIQKYLLGDHYVPDTIEKGLICPPPIIPIHGDHSTSHFPIKF